MRVPKRNLPPGDRYPLRTVENVLILARTIRVTQTLCRETIFFTPFVFSFQSFTSFFGGEVSIHPS